jgi:preprotein translocase subunit SecA
MIPILKSGQVYHPPANRSYRPEKKERRSNAVEKVVLSLTGGVTRFVQTHTVRPGRIIPLVSACGPAMSAMKDQEIKDAGRQLGLKIRRQGFRDELVAQSFALIREAAWRTLGLRHFDTQIMGGWVMLPYGHLGGGHGRAGGHSRPCYLCE